LEYFLNISLFINQHPRKRRCLLSDNYIVLSSTSSCGLLHSSDHFNRSHASISLQPWDIVLNHRIIRSSSEEFRITGRLTWCIEKSDTFYLSAIFCLIHPYQARPHSPRQTPSGCNQPCCHSWHVRTNRWAVGGRMFNHISAPLY